MHAEQPLADDASVSMLNDLALIGDACATPVSCQLHERPEIVSNDKVAGTKWLSLRTIGYNWPRGPARQWDYVTRRKDEEIDLRRADAVVIVALYTDAIGQRFLIAIKEFRFAVGDFELGLPAGLIDQGETPEETARRELREETGLEITEILQTSPMLFTSGGLTDESVIMVIAECKGDIRHAAGDEERIEVVSLDMDGVRDALKQSPYSMSARLWPVLLLLNWTGRI